MLLIPLHSWATEEKVDAQIVEGDGNDNVTIVGLEDTSNLTQEVESKQTTTEPEDTDSSHTSNGNERFDNAPTSASEANNADDVELVEEDLESPDALMSDEGLSSTDDSPSDSGATPNCILEAQSVGEDTEREPNDDEGTATLLTITRPMQSILGTVDPAAVSDTDCFNFVLEESSFVTLRISGSFPRLGGFYDVSVGRYSDDGKSVESWFLHWNSTDAKLSLPTDEDLDLSCLNAGRYCISIMYYSGEPYASHSLDSYRYSILVNAEPVVKTDISNAIVKSIPNQVFTGKPITPSLSISYDGKVLRRDIDYSITYTNNTDIGTARANVVGKGSFEGRISLPFEIILPSYDIDQTIELSDGTAWQGERIISPGHSVAATFTVDNDSLGIISTEIGYTSTDDYIGTAHGELWYFDNAIQDWTLIDSWPIRRVYSSGSTVPTFINVPLSMRAGQYRYIIAPNNQYTVTLNMVGYSEARVIDDGSIEAEPNQSMNQASSLNRNGLVYGTINHGGADTSAHDCDWYSFSIDEPTHVVLSAYLPLLGTENASLSLRLNDEDGKTVNHSATRKPLNWNENNIKSNEGNAVLDCGALKAGSYYLEVRGDVSGDGSEPLSTNIKSLLYYSIELSGFGGDIENATIRTIPTQEYCGSPITPPVVVEMDGATLVEGTDYSISYEDNINAGTASVNIFGIGACRGATSREFEIKPMSISSRIVTAPTVAYTGKPIVLSSLSLINGSDIIEIFEGIDYEIVRAYNNIDSNEIIGGYGSHSSTVDGVKYWFGECGGLSIRGINNYSGANVAIIEIVRKRVAIPEIATSVVYDGTEKECVAAGEGYRLTGTSSAVDAGNYTATVSLADYKNYIWDTEDNHPLYISWSILPASLQDARIEIEEVLTYDGQAATPVPVVRLGEKTLIENTDYTVSYESNASVGTAEATITGKGNYTGTKSTTFTIEPADVAKATVSDIANKTYNGKAQTQAPTVKVGSAALKSGTDYTLSYKSNTNAGTATVTVTGKGNYTGSLSKTFKISPASVSKATVSAVAEQAYTGKVITPKPAVKLGSTTLKLGTDYTLSYKANTKVGTATVTATGKGNYAGTKSVTFKIVNWAGASRIPVKGTARHTLLKGGYMRVLVNGKKAASDAYVSISGATITGKKAGKTTVYLYDPKGRQVARKTVEVFAAHAKTFEFESSVDRSYVLDIQGGSKKDGAQMIVYKRNNGKNQRYTLYLQSDGTYAIRSLNSKKWLTVESKTNKYVQQWAWKKGNNTDQRWRLTVDSANRATFVNVKTNKCFDVQGGKTKNSAKMIVWQSNGGLNQKWRLNQK